MPRNLSPLAISAAQATETDQVFLLLLVIRHPSNPAPIRLVNNTDNIISNGETFQAYPFDLVLGVEDGNHLPAVQLTIDNVDQLLMETIRKFKEAPTITIKLVLASSPNTVELNLEGMTLREVTFDAYTINGTLFVESLKDTRYPRDVISLASGYEGLFR